MGNSFSSSAHILFFCTTIRIMDGRDLFFFFLVIRGQGDGNSTRGVIRPVLWSSR